ncbi:MAG: RluA family pseudouridine synthase [Planctomycetes bacterium]|nr:RluA family pseudouridine synthase [Planctomycetota bacterium]
MPRDSIPVLYQDAHLVIVDKPAPRLVVGAPGRRGPTVVDLLQAQLAQRLIPVHRLDEQVTGVLLLALNEVARAALEAMFRDHRVQRTYLALLSHAPDPPAGRIESRLREGRDGVVRSVVGGAGERAVTLYRTLARRGRHTLVECQLETGRRNQIRAHMGELGCPIVGDRKYGYRVRGGASFPRPLLHAERVGFAHPITGEAVAVACEPAEPELRRGESPDYS